ncbi:hypothetical protein CYMTET_25043, partial [Cymbomonas tetramitiformis]
VATVQFKVLAGFSVTALAATVQGLQTSSAQFSQSYAAVAGQGMVAQAGRRHRHLLSFWQEVEDAAADRAGRQQGAQARRLQSWGELFGDVNGDGVFDTFDTQALKKWATGYPGYGMDEVGSLSAFQRQQLDPTLDYLSAADDVSNCPTGWDVGTPCPSPLDAQYLQYVYANFLRFVKLETQADAEPEISGGEMTISVAIYDKSSVPVASDTTVVQYELGTTQNTDMQVLVGSSDSTTSDGWTAFAVGPNNTDGSFTLSTAGMEDNATRFRAETGVGVVFILRTYDTQYASSDERVFAFCGSALVGSSFSPFTTFDFPQGSPSPPPLPPAPPPPSPPPPPIAPPPSPLHPPPTTSATFTSPSLLSPPHLSAPTSTLRPTVTTDGGNF